MMRYHEYRPSPALASLVHRVWTLQGTAQPQKPAFQRAMPDGRAELIFNLGDSFEQLDRAETIEQPRMLIVGNTRRAMQIRPTGKIDLIGIRLRPDAVAGLFQLPGRELMDRATDLTLLPRRLDPTLSEQLADTGDESARLGLLERHLRVAAGYARPHRRLRAAVELVLRSRDPLIAGRAADLVGLSYRQLSRLFRERVGFGPKILARITRFQRLLRTLELRPNASWSTLAAETGYYDQPHLTREFRAFAAVSPRVYRAELRELTRHFIDQGEGELPADGRSVQDGSEPNL
jgi:AraC-like DNA-binding protein